MKKALARSTTFTDLARALPLALLCAAPAGAQLPAPGCWARDFDAAHLAANPGQGVAGLRLWYFHEDAAGRFPAVLVEARMAQQGQALRDGVAGMTLTQYALCDAEGSCAVECDGGVFTTSLRPDGRLGLETRHFTLGEGSTCGGTSNLSEGGVTAYLLSPAPEVECASLSRVFPLPEAGCYGVDYADMTRGQGLLGMRLFLRPADEGHAFPQAEGTLGVRLPDAGTARAAGMGGARIAVPIWCTGRDGLCRAGVDEGALRIEPLADGVALTTSRFFVFGAEAASLDIAWPGQAETRHRLHPMPADQCRGME